MPPEKVVSNPAGFWLRLGANLFDAAVMFVVQYLLLLGVGVVDAFTRPGFDLPVMALLLFTLIGPIFYWAYMRSNRRTSPGYQVTGLRLELMSGAPVSFGRSVVRLVLTQIVVAMVAIFALIDWLLMLLNKDRRAVHDLIFGTKVVAVRKSRQDVLWGCIGLYGVLIGLIAARTIPLPLQAFYIPAASMQPTLAIGDRLLANPL